ncbi:sulfatase family protein [Pseudonocardia kunmingensis]|uniref:Arylsulfatase A-like enzyme n=1 Tax=Pseudonocardia kunmingensis TaxID=630975 RepID=A0A543D0P2_9PSEU|nr:sulfatase [Pseudonocardia kunmingensis]TQM02892.1 arylsulfatase A-like enzyme [Pseudonocardia kunmingensis]
MRRPNVVVVHWHDLGTHLRAYGYGVNSPHADALAEQSTVFERCFSTSPLCSPARGALWTGRYPHSNGLQGLTHRGWEYGEGERPLPMHLGGAGYRTVLVGIQHESRDHGRLGFGEHLGASNHAGDVAEAAARWLDARRDEDGPFLLVCGMLEVHRGWPAERYPPDPPGAVDVPGYLPDNEHTREDIAAFGGAITVADRGLGIILDALRRNELDDDTVVVFTTDHGAPFPRAKSTLYDPGVHVALMVRMPPRLGPAGPRREPGLVSHVDVVPTLLELLGVAVPDDVQGVSFAATLRDGAAPTRREVFLEKTYHADYDPIRAIRTDSYKYIHNFEPRPLLALPPDLEASTTRRGMGDAHLAPRPQEELYDLVADPGETTNLVDDPGSAEIAGDLRERLDAFMLATDDALRHGPVPVPVSDAPALVVDRTG